MKARPKAPFEWRFKHIVMIAIAAYLVIMVPLWLLCILLSPLNLILR